MLRFIFFLRIILKSNPVNVQLNTPCPTLGQVYLNLRGDIEPTEFRDSPGATLHLWTAKNDPFMSFTAHRNPDGDYSGTFRSASLGRATKD
jgi:hypothetical protein